MKRYILIWISSIGLFTSCINTTEENGEGVFESIPFSKSGLNFENLLNEELLKNPFNYVNAYTGGGVAIGDINNDGLQDIYFTSNMGSSKLFLNKGEMTFEDITVQSGTSTTGWSSAVTMADVNNDGWMTSMCADLIMMMEKTERIYYFLITKMELLQMWPEE